MSLYKRVLDLVDEIAPDEPDGEMALAVAQLVLRAALEACEAEEIYPDERWGGIYNVAVKACTTAIRGLRADLDVGE